MEGQLTNPLIHYRYDFCHKCNRQSIECYDFFNSPIGYTRLVNAKLAGKNWETQMPRNKTIFSMECKSCGEQYIICYDSKDFFPYPTEKNFFPNRAFFAGYKDDGIEFFREKQLDLSNL